MELIKKKVSELIPYINNSRTHSEEQITQLVSSIKEFGFTNPILLAPDNSIIAGHGRLQAVKRLGHEEVPCIVVEGLTKTQIKALIIADNQLALNAGWDLEKLSVEIEGLDDDKFDLKLLGFEDQFLKDLLKEDVKGLIEDDETPEVDESKVKSKLSDIWILGDHRLLCGDSTKEQDVLKLINNTNIDLIFTDPPYGINEKGDRTGRNTGLAKNHNFKDFKDDSIDYAVQAYQIAENLLKVKRQVWWGANYYCHFLPHSNNWFVWDKRVEEKMKDTQSDCELAWVKSKWSSVRIFRHLWKGFNKDSERNQKRVHPTQKPIALAEWSFDYFKEVNTVLDLFGGSGSTLIACQKQNKKCFMMEFEPLYTDTIIQRWQQFTGKEAIHEESGKTYNSI
jgi:ParB-like chromosome segregation protein Spo0J